MRLEDNQAKEGSEDVYPMEEYGKMTSDLSSIRRSHKIQIKKASLPTMSMED